MALLRWAKRGERVFAYCHADEVGEPMCAGHEVPVDGVHAVPSSTEGDHILLKHRWRTDGRHWFCPKHVRLCRELHASLFDAATKGEGSA